MPNFSDLPSDLHKYVFPEYFTTEERARLSETSRQYNAETTMGFLPGHEPISLFYGKEDKKEERLEKIEEHFDKLFNKKFPDILFYETHTIRNKKERKLFNLTFFKDCYISRTTFDFEDRLLKDDREDDIRNEYNYWMLYVFRSDKILLIKENIISDKNSADYNKYIGFLLYFMNGVRKQHVLEKFTIHPKNHELFKELYIGKVFSSNEE